MLHRMFNRMEGERRMKIIIKEGEIEMINKIIKILKTIAITIGIIMVAFLVPFLGYSWVMFFPFSFIIFAISFLIIAFSIIGYNIFKNLD